MKILLNGVGRIGKAILKQLVSDKNFEIVMINEINPYVKNIVYSINYDSTYGFISFITTISKSLFVSSCFKIALPILPTPFKRIFII